MTDDKLKQTADWMIENDVDPDAYEAFLDGVNFGLEQLGTDGLSIADLHDAYLDCREGRGND